MGWRPHGNVAIFHQRKKKYNFWEADDGVGTFFNNNFQFSLNGFDGPRF